MIYSLQTFVKIYKNVMHSYQKLIQELYIQYNANQFGLTSEQVIQLQKKGLNRLNQTKQHKTKIKIFISQFTNVLMLLLVSVGIVSFLLHEITDAIVIGITVLINAFVGYIQENKANTSLEQLQSMVQYYAYVLRDGVKHKIKSDELVPGDILFIEAGDSIQADARLLEVSGLLVNESALTGESKPVIKSIKQYKKEMAIGDRANMIFRGTNVMQGHAKALVVETGFHTEIGKIASLVKNTKEEKTPLQIALAKLSSSIGVIVLVIAVVVFILGFITNATYGNIAELFSISVAIAVAAIPEGLVISLTIILAIGMNSILKKKALVRKLIAAETLGSVDVICTDKTGTITKGMMAITYIESADGNDIYKNISKKIGDSYKEIIIAGVIANDAFFDIYEDTQKKQIIGDTTDIAFFELAQENNIQI